MSDRLNCFSASSSVANLQPFSSRSRACIQGAVNDKIESVGPRRRTGTKNIHTYAQTHAHTQTHTHTHTCMLAQDGAVEPPEANDLGVLGPALLDGDGDERSAADLQRRSGGGRGGGGRGGGRSGSLLGDTDTDSRGEGPPPAVDAVTAAAIAAVRAAYAEHARSWLSYPAPLPPTVRDRLLGAGITGRRLYANLVSPSGAGLRAQVTAPDGSLRSLTWPMRREVRGWRRCSSGTGSLCALFDPVALGITLMWCLAAHRFGVPRQYPFRARSSRARRTCSSSMRSSR